MAGRLMCTSKLLRLVHLAFDFGAQYASEGCDMTNTLDQNWATHWKMNMPPFIAEHPVNEHIQ